MQTELYGVLAVLTSVFGPTAQLLLAIQVALNKLAVPGGKVLSDSRNTIIQNLKVVIDQLTNVGNKNFMVVSFPWDTKPRYVKEEDLLNVLDEELKDKKDNHMKFTIGAQIGKPYERRPLVPSPSTAVGQLVKPQNLVLTEDEDLLLVSIDGSKKLRLYTAQ